MLATWTKNSGHINIEPAGYSESFGRAIRHKISPLPQIASALHPPHSDAGEQVEFYQTIFPLKFHLIKAFKRHFSSRPIRPQSCDLIHLKTNQVYMIEEDVIKVLKSSNQTPERAP